MSRNNHHHHYYNNKATMADSITDTSVFKSEATPTQSIKVIGVGGGGNNAVEHMFRQGIQDVSFVLINTDRQVLDESAVPNKLVIGPGRGAGGKPEVARQFAEDNAEAIQDIFDSQTDMVFITAGMGGGTGTGAGPVVARMAKERGILTVGIVTIPFLFEGRKKVLKALEGAEEMAKNVDALLIINNERLTEIYPDYEIINAFSKADDTLLNAAQGITEIITKRGIINRDFNDVDSTLREGGSAIISSGYGEGEHRVTKAIEDALHSPLLKDTDIIGSKKMLMILYISDDPNQPFLQSETSELTSFISSIDKEVDVMWGLYKAPDLGNKVKITILASGFNVTVDTDSSEDAAQPRKIDTIIDDTYGADRAAGMSRGNFKIIDPDHIDDESTMASLETETAASRRGRFNNNTSATRPAQNSGNDSSSKFISFDDI